MKPKLLSIIAVAALGAVVFVTLGATDESERNSSREIKELRKLAARLEDRISDLEKRLKSVEAKTNWIVQPRAYLPPRSPRIYPWPGVVLQEPQGKSGSPKIWNRGEVNGWPYYVVPVDGIQSPPN